MQDMKPEVKKELEKIELFDGEPKFPKKHIAPKRVVNRLRGQGRGR